MAALSLLMAGAEERALLVLRLAAILLPCYLLAEITALLEFLHAVSRCSEPRIRPAQVTNQYTPPR